MDLLFGAKRRPLFKVSSRSTGSLCFRSIGVKSLVEFIGCQGYRFAPGRGRPWLPVFQIPGFGHIGTNQQPPERLPFFQSEVDIPELQTGVSRSPDSPLGAPGSFQRDLDAMSGERPRPQPLLIADDADSGRMNSSRTDSSGTAGGFCWFP